MRPLARRSAWLGGVVVLLLLAAAWAAELAPAPGPLTVVVGGLVQDYLEPCGCGGQTAGGLARRAARLADLRAGGGPLVAVDIGDLGVRADRWPVVLRALGAMGIDACGLSRDDLAALPQIEPLAAAGAVPLTSLAAPAGDPAVAPSLVLEPVAGRRVGIVALAFSDRSLGDLSGGLTAELERVTAAGCELRLVISHLGETATAWLLRRLPERLRPELAAIATEDNDLAVGAVRDGVRWLPVTAKGRSLITVRRLPSGDVTVEQELLAAGPTDARIAGWIDDYYRRLRAGEEASAAVDDGTSSFLPPAACEACHAASVTAWRRHSHARAVERLEVIGRDVASCLRCHSERLRSDGRRPLATGDRGVQCASCHGELAAHAAGEGRPAATSLSPAGCRSCHTVENSPRWDEAKYLASVLAACRGELARPPGDEEKQP